MPAWTSRVNSVWKHYGDGCCDANDDKKKSIKCSKAIHLISPPPPGLQPLPPRPLQLPPHRIARQQVMHITDLYQLRPAVIAPGFCIPAIIPSCSNIGPSTSAASLEANPSIILPDATACSPRPGTSRSNMYLYTTEHCQHVLLLLLLPVIYSWRKMYFHCYRVDLQDVFCLYYSKLS